MLPDSRPKHRRAQRQYNGEKAENENMDNRQKHPRKGRVTGPYRNGPEICPQEWQNKIPPPLDPPIYREPG
jgi:hypothetical protein